MILGSEIGGTWVLLGLAENDVLVSARRSASADFLNFTDLLAAFLAMCRSIHPKCIAVAWR